MIEIEAISHKSLIYYKNIFCQTFEILCNDECQPKVESVKSEN